jgi:hypothetical protein
MLSLKALLLTQVLGAGAALPPRICPHATPDGAHVFLYGTVATVRGTLVQVKGAKGEGAAAWVLQLDAPLTALSEGQALQSECDQPRIELLLTDEALLRQAQKLEGKPVQASGKLGHAFAAEHQTPLLLEVKALAAAGKP